MPKTGLIAGITWMTGQDVAMLKAGLTNLRFAPRYLVGADRAIA